MKKVAAFLLIALLLAMLMSCNGPLTSTSAKLTARDWTQGGEADRGHDLIRHYGCHTCHTIPGVAGANGNVGPPLTLIAHRSFIAGEIPNNPGNLVQWIKHPRSIEPKTAMPEMGVSDQDAKDIAAYLYTLR